MARVRSIRLPAQTYFIGSHPRRQVYRPRNCLRIPKWNYLPDSSDCKDICSAIDRESIFLVYKLQLKIEFDLHSVLTRPCKQEGVKDAFYILNHKENLNSCKHV
ncbi:hypothetical protein SUGI_0251830 [Cryptomeria japonica]|nr:hypothetical protein SUGI_0251830 [Cryptomeria japonica]